MYPFSCYLLVNRLQKLQSGNVPEFVRGRLMNSASSIYMGIQKEKTKVQFVAEPMAIINTDCYVLSVQYTVITMCLCVDVADYRDTTWLEWNFPNAQSRSLYYRRNWNSSWRCFVTARRSTNNSRSTSRSWRRPAKSNENTPLKAMIRYICGLILLSYSTC